MKNIITFLSIAALAVSVPASAETLRGDLTVQKGAGPILTCDTTVTFTGGVVSSITMVDVGSSFGCFTVTFNPSTPKDSSNPSIALMGGNYVISNIYADTSITVGDCGMGPLTANAIGGNLYSVNGTLDDLHYLGTNNGDCRIAGVVVHTP